MTAQQIQTGEQQKKWTVGRLNATSVYHLDRDCAELKTANKVRERSDAAIEWHDLEGCSRCASEDGDVEMEGDEKGGESGVWWSVRGIGRIPPRTAQRVREGFL